MWNKDDVENLFGSHQVVGCSSLKNTKNKRIIDKNVLKMKELSCCDHNS
jgi:hypothetical protein